MELIIKHFSQLSARELYDILELRVSVFVVEQNCPYQELDGHDRNAYHVWLQDDDGIQAYLRVLDKGVTMDEVAIGRVVTRQRRIGLGTKILNIGIEVAKEKYAAKKIMLEAQVYAKSLYEKAGFRQMGEEFLEDGIPHIPMLLEV
ncbi:MAG: GNAT family N-acetyltransferase [Ruminococcaceae bacterium]|nr:GNAT family N-acetyltransferase [Oscillospiraceae bacterium]